MTLILAALESPRVLLQYGKYIVSYLNSAKTRADGAFRGLLAVRLDGLLIGGIGDDQVVPADGAEHQLGAFGQHVAVQALGAQQRHAPLERLFFGGDKAELGIGLVDLVAQVPPGDQSAVALHGVIAEVGHHRRAHEGHHDLAGFAGEILGKVLCGAQRDNSRLTAESKRITAESRGQRRQSRTDSFFRAGVKICGGNDSLYDSECASGMI